MESNKLNSVESIKKALSSLKNGCYDFDDVKNVVSHFTEVGKSILTRKKHLHYLISDWKDFQIELDDVVLDYIAPLFARDEEGIFIELKKYFEFDSDLSIEDQIYKLLHSTIHQESIKTFEYRDPIGKVFYRSLRYILSKHPNWEKRKNNGQLVITVSDNETEIATPDRIIETLKLNEEGSTSLVKALESCLSKLLDEDSSPVIVAELLYAIRKKLAVGPSDSGYHDPSHEMTVQLHINNTIEQIGIDVLERYVLTNKLSPEESIGFKTALRAMLNDFQENYSNGSYFSYLSRELSELHSEEEYREKYRTQFEYVAKMAKRTFSASIKTDYKV